MTARNLKNIWRFLDEETHLSHEDDCMIILFDLTVPLFDKRWFEFDPTLLYVGALRGTESHLQRQTAYAGLEKDNEAGKLPQFS